MGCFAVFLILFESRPAFRSIPTFQLYLREFCLAVNYGNSQVFTYLMPIFNMLIFLSSTILPGRVIRQAQLEREANAEFKTSWVEFISHEMRTPLGIISMGLELTKSSVLAGTRDSADIMATLSDLEVPCGRAVGLLDQLLYLERLEKSDVHLELSTITPLQLLRETARGVVKPASDAGVRLNARFLEGAACFDVESLRIKVDKDRICFILSKILTQTIAARKLLGEVSIEFEVVPKDGSSLQR